MNKATSKAKVEPPVNLKEQNATHSFRLTIRDREHFYRVIKWMNENVGKGADKWTIEGRVLKSLKQGKAVDRKIYVFREDFDESSALFLSLI
jgi:hypothetical protein